MPAAIYIGPPRTEEEFRQYFDLRWQVLRAPWGAPRGSEQDEHEDAGVHVLACDEDEVVVVAVGRLHFVETQLAQIRFMATLPGRRGQGLGKRIVKELETAARSRGAKTIVLNARREAAEFYTKLGFTEVGKGPKLFGSVEHVVMQKTLTSDDG